LAVPVLVATGFQGSDSPRLFGSTFTLAGWEVSDIVNVPASARPLALRL